MSSTNSYAASTKVCCVLCHSEVTLINLSKHYNSKMCKSGGKSAPMSHCQYCNEPASKFKNFGSHVSSCKLRPISANQKRSRTNCPSGKIGKPGGNQYTKARRLGLPDPVMTGETREKKRNNMIGKRLSDEVKAKISDSMKRVVKNKPEMYAGRYNRGHVKSYNVGGFEVIGTWERDFVLYCEQHNIRIVKPITPFPYTWKSKTRLYFPDFYLPDHDCFIEVKGYMTERDICKISDFPNKIQVIGKSEIYKIKSGSFDIDRFLA